MIFPKVPSEKVSICREKKHRYGDSNPGFRTENPIREADLERLGHVSAHLGRWSSVEFAGVGDKVRDKVSIFAGCGPEPPARPMGMSR